MNKMGKTLAVMAVMGAGVAGAMMYKKKNPDAFNSAKQMAKNTATKMLEKLENME